MTLHMLRCPLVPDVMTVPQVARLFKVSGSTVTRWAENGRLLGFRTPGGQWRFRRSDVEAFFPDEPAEATA